MEPKPSAMSASTTWTHPKFSHRQMASEASLALRLGRPPQEMGSPWASKPPPAPHTPPAGPRPALPRPARLWEVDPPDRACPGGPLPQLRGDAGQERLDPDCLDVGDRLAVDPLAPLVPLHPRPRPLQHIRAVELVPQRVEPAISICLGCTVQGALQSLGPSRRTPLTLSGLASACRCTRIHR